MSKQDVFFLSDAHFGINLPGCNQREADFIRFLHDITPQAHTVFLLGDIFDFWIEYPSVIRRDYFAVLCALHQLVQSGTTVHYLAGNHDFALGSFLHQQLGITTHAGVLQTTVQNKKLYLYHGDGILGLDIGYRILKKILRHPLNQRLYKLLHPSLGIGLAERLSGASRKYLNGRLSQKHIDAYRDNARTHLAQGSDIVVYGHIHHPHLFRDHNKVYCNTGEWIRRYSYARLSNGNMTLWQHNPGGVDTQLAEEVAKEGSS